MMDELKACPFCGSSNTTLDYYEISCPQELGTIVVCNDCGASAKSIVDWNTRPIEDALNARIAELEAENDILKDHLREAKNILIDKNLQIDSLYEEGYKLQQRIAELEAENAALKAEPKPLAYWSDEKKQTYADNEGRSAKRSEE
jgi:BMFP domain-containing protein YqiC